MEQPVPERDSTAESGSRDGAAPDLFCPKCLYNLTGTEQAGLDCCPECGEPLDFDALRTMVRTGLDLSGFTWWQLVWKLFLLRRKFHNEVRRRHYFIRLPEVQPRYTVVLLLAFVAMLLWTGMVAWLSGIRGILLCGLVAACLAVMGIVHAGERVWLRLLLDMAHHPDARAAAGRILYVANTQFVPMTVNLALCVVTMGIVVLVGSRSNAVITMALTVGLSAAFINVALWLDWSRHVYTLFMSEGYYRTGGNAVRGLVVFNPGCFLALVILVGWGLVVIITSVPESL
ncbi:MAG: hypothetical protein JXL80_03990 [Planctomycetes bacterium]|nr:hypothetical protein [Planctomycetota bacterium]